MVKERESLGKQGLHAMSIITYSNNSWHSSFSPEIRSLLTQHYFFNLCSTEQLSFTIKIFFPAAFVCIPKPFLFLHLCTFLFASHLHSSVSWNFSFLLLRSCTLFLNKFNCVEFNNNALLIIKILSCLCIIFKLLKKDYMFFSSVRGSSFLKWLRQYIAKC
jgi:hypothetical protein